MTLVPLDIDKLKSLAEDRGMSIPIIMKILGIRQLGTQIPAEMKADIWELLGPDGKFSEIKRGFPQATVWKVTDMTPGAGGGG